MLVASTITANTIPFTPTPNYSGAPPDKRHSSWPKNDGRD
jgi:hypothetical protein